MLITLKNFALILNNITYYCKEYDAAQNYIDFLFQISKIIVQFR